MNHKKLKERYRKRLQRQKKKEQEKHLLKQLNAERLKLKRADKNGRQAEEEKRIKKNVVEKERLKLKRADKNRRQAEEEKRIKKNIVDKERLKLKRADKTGRQAEEEKRIKKNVVDKERLKTKRADEHEKQAEEDKRITKNVVDKERLKTKRADEHEKQAEEDKRITKNVVDSERLKTKRAKEDMRIKKNLVESERLKKTIHNQKVNAMQQLRQRKQNEMRKRNEESANALKLERQTAYATNDKELTFCVNKFWDNTGSLVSQTEIIDDLCNIDPIKIIDKYNKHMLSGVYRQACCACGQLYKESQLQIVDWSSEMLDAFVFKLEDDDDDVDIDEIEPDVIVGSCDRPNQCNGEFHLWTHRSLHGSRLYALMDTEVVKLCPRCIPKNNACKNQLAFVNYDIGNVEGLHIPVLNDIEEDLLSYRKLFARVVKLKPHGSRKELKTSGHTVCLKHDAVEEGVQVCSVPRKISDVRLVFIGSGKELNIAKHHRHFAGKGSLQKVKLGWHLVHPNLKRDGADWDEVQCDVPPEQVQVDHTYSTKRLDERLGANYAEARFETNDKVFVTNELSRGDDVLVPAMAAAASGGGGGTTEKVPEVEADVIGGMTNEIENIGMMLQQTFPWLFPLGPLPTKLSLHRIATYLLNFYDKRFERCAMLVIYLADLLQRMNNANAAKHAVMVNAAKAEAFLEMVQNEGFKDVLEAAAKDPSSTEAKELVKDMKPMLRVAGPKVDWSVMKRNGFIGKLYAFTQLFAASQWFVTVTIQPSNSKWCLKLTFRDTEEELLVWEKLLTDQQMRSSRVGENPTAHAKYYELMIVGLTSCFFDLPDARHTRSTKSRRDTNGILGETRAYAIATEATGTFSLHGHCVVWATVHAGRLAEIIHREDVQTKLLNFLDATV